MEALRGGRAAELLNDGPWAAQLGPGSSSSGRRTHANRRWTEEGLPRNWQDHQRVARGRSAASLVREAKPAALGKQLLEEDAKHGDEFTSMHRARGAAQQGGRRISTIPNRGRRQWRCWTFRPMQCSRIRDPTSSPTWLPSPEALRRRR